MTDRSSTDLPYEIADRITKPFARFLRIEAAAGGLLFLAAALALVLSNSAWSMPFLAFWETPIGLHFGALDFSRSLRHWINDGLMTFFFFVISLELKRELVLGELRNLRTAALPFAAALGGMLVPVSLYLALTVGEPGMYGWGTVMATDTAFVIGCLALFGSRIPAALRLFLLSLAIFDDVGAILVVAVGYGEALNWPALALGMLGLGTVAGAARLGIPEASGAGLFAFVWIAAIFGAVLKLRCPRRWDRLSIAAYILLGWSFLVALDQMLAALSRPAAILLITGGILYTCGVAFHVSTRLPYQNAIWHACVLIAAGCHYAAIIGYVAA